MKTVVTTLVSKAPYSQSRHYEVDMLDKELHRDYEVRTWRERVHCFEDSQECYIPPMSFKNMLSEAAKFLSIKIPGKGQALYTKHVEAGVLVTDPLRLGVLKNDVHGEWLFVPSDGKRGGGSRVSKCFPLYHSWRGDVVWHILDETITKDVFAYILEQGGNFIGLGRFRPRNNGFYGRFDVKKINWS